MDSRVRHAPQPRNRWETPLSSSSSVSTHHIPPLLSLTVAPLCCYCSHQHPGSCSSSCAHSPSTFFVCCLVLFGGREAGLSTSNTKARSHSNNLLIPIEKKQNGTRRQIKQNRFIRMSYNRSLKPNSIVGLHLFVMKITEEQIKLIVIL